MNEAVLSIFTCRWLLPGARSCLRKLCVDLRCQRQWADVSRQVKFKAGSPLRCCRCAQHLPNQPYPGLQSP